VRCDGREAKRTRCSRGAIASALAPCSGDDSAGSMLGRRQRPAARADLMNNAVARGEKVQGHQCVSALDTPALAELCARGSGGSARVRRRK
jgi:hypothetical protein